jgi:2-oxoisovalerate dehydrogenase E1 component alpha subunit
MLQCRILDKRVRELSKSSGKTAQPSVREATAVGAAIDLRREDWLAPSQNDLLGKLLKGVPLASIFSELHQHESGKGTGTTAATATESRQDHSPFHLIPSAANPAAQLNLASGVALALQAKKTGSIVMVFCGDTSDSSQRWQEALTFAGKHCLPLVVVVHSEGSAKATSAKKGKTFLSLLSEGHACELPVIPVDAEDVVAIYRVAFESIHKARHGGGPTVIQAISFPAPSGGKSAEAHASEPADAIVRMEDYLAAKGLFSPLWKQKLIYGFNRELTSAIEATPNAPLRNRK